MRLSRNSEICQKNITRAGDASSSNVDASSSKMQFDEGECKVCFKKIDLLLVNSWKLSLYDVMTFSFWLDCKWYFFTPWKSIQKLYAPFIFWFVAFMKLFFLHDSYFFVLEVYFVNIVMFWKRQFIFSKFDWTNVFVDTTQWVRIVKKNLHIMIANFINLQ